MINMEQCGLRKISPEELAVLAEKGELDRIVVSKFGHYFNQSPETILATKAYDIQHNQLGSKKPS